MPTLTCAIFNSADGFHMTIYAANNHTTNVTYVPVENTETEILGPTVRPDPSVPAATTGTSALATGTSDPLPPQSEDAPSLSESLFPTTTLLRPLGEAPPVSVSALPTPYPSSGSGLKNIDDSAAFIRVTSAIPQVTITVTVTTTREIAEGSPTATVAASMSWADGVHSLAPAAVYTDEFWTSDVLHPSST